MLDNELGDLAIAERLAESDPGNAGWQRDLSVSLGWLARLVQIDGDIAGATAHYERAEHIMASLVAKMPDHPGFASDLRHIHTQLVPLGAEA